MIPIGDLVGQVATALSGAAHVTRQQYQGHVEALAGTPSKLPGSPTQMQTTHLAPLVPADLDWEGNLYLEVRDGQVMADFAPEKPTKRRRGIGRLTVRHRAGDTPEGIHRVLDVANADLDVRLREADLTPAKPTEPTFTLHDILRAAIRQLEKGHTDDE